MQRRVKTKGLNRPVSENLFWTFFIPSPIFCPSIVVLIWFRKPSLKKNTLGTIEKKEFQKVLSNYKPYTEVPLTSHTSI